MGDNLSANIVDLNAKDGVATFDRRAALTRLHYFDGKFLRADALTLEQDYHRRLVALSNLAGGWGVVHGLGVEWAGNILGVTPGLAITPAGSTVLLTGPVSVEIARLVAAATAAPVATESPSTTGNAEFAECILGTPAATPEGLGTGYFELTVGPFEALCGNEEVYGKLCEDACVTDSQRPYWREGVVLRLRPINLTLPVSAAIPPVESNLRNRVASAYFAAEPWLSKSLLSAQGLASPVWCNPAVLCARDEVPIGLLVREGGTTLFFDAWSARRERMDTQARGYWQGRMMMRPWNVFMAQILQFQCQLPGAFKPGSKAFDPGDDECVRLRELLAASAKSLEAAHERYTVGNIQFEKLFTAGNAKEGKDFLSALQERDKQFQEVTRQLVDAKALLKPFTPNRLLLNAGFVELPSAGYLPVVPSKQPVNEQLQRMFGEGVDLHFCTARPDYIPHAVEEAQHMERISLTRGLDDPKSKEQVEIFVPNGEIVDALGTRDGTHWFTETSLATLSAFMLSMRMTPAEKPAAGEDTPEIRLETMLKAYSAALDSHTEMPLTGVSRTTRLDGGGAAVTLACRMSNASQAGMTQETAGELRGLASGTAAERAANTTTFRLMRGILDMALYADLRINEDPFAMREGDEVPLNFEVRMSAAGRVASATGNSRAGEVMTGDGALTIESIHQVDTGVQSVMGTVRMHVSTASVGNIGGGTETPPETFMASVPIVLQREGNAHAGLLFISPGSLRGESRTATRFAWTAQWAGTPRNAVFGIRRDRIMERATWQNTGPIAASGANMGFGATSPEGELTIKTIAATSTIPFAKLREADAPLAPESPARLAALNTLALIADATDDDAFLMRARRRLFPDAVLEPAIRVRANLDWVMFRRQRRADCDVPCRYERPVVTEAFQTWHLKLDSLERLGALKLAMESGDAERVKLLLKGLELRRIDVLHYGDASSAPVESSSRIIDDWKDAQGRKLSVGWVWETSPRVGQGWQNNVRTKQLLKILSNVIESPATGVIHALQSPPAAFTDLKFDGGMLLVTSAPKQVQKIHRVFLVTITEVAKPQIMAEIAAKSKKLVQVLTQLKVDNRTVTFDGDTPVKEELDAVVEAYRAHAATGGEAVVVVRDGLGGEATQALGESKDICKVLPTVTAAAAVSSMPVADFGLDAFAATIVFLEMQDAPAVQRKPLKPKPR